MKIDGVNYIPRLIDPVIEQHLKAFGAVEISGTMWSGKTWTARAHGKSITSLNDENTLRLAEIDTEAVLQGIHPHVIDEWQEVPQIWDYVRTQIDNAAGKRGLYILTGSSSPAKDMVRHTGSGRISKLRMWPMSLAESGHSNSSVSITDLFGGKFESGPVKTNLEKLATLICRGGWPGAITLKDDIAQLIPVQYLDALLTKTDEKASGNEREMRQFLQSLARNIGSATTLQTIAKDMQQDISKKSSSTVERHVRAHLDYFISKYVICELNGWDAPIKSPRRLRTKPKHCFADPSLPASLLGVSPQTLMGNMQLFGQLFEELCLRDLRVYSQTMSNATPEPLRYYRDSDGLEVDAIIELRDGRWGAIEIKLGDNKADIAAKNLLRLKNKVQANPAARNPEPSFLLVLVGKADFKYKTANGVYVVPITELGV